QLTGERPETVSPLKANLTMEQPEPANVQDWVDSGLEKYVGVLIAEAGLDSVEAQYNATRANHLPTVKLVASYSDGDQYQFSANGTIPVQSTFVSIQASMPLFSGGSLYGRSKQVAQSYAATEFNVEKQ